MELQVEAKVEGQVTIGGMLRIDKKDHRLYLTRKDLTIEYNLLQKRANDLARIAPLYCTIRDMLVGICGKSSKAIVTDRNIMMVGIGYDPSVRIALSSLAYEDVIDLIASQLHRKFGVDWRFRLDGTTIELRSNSKEYPICITLSDVEDCKIKLQSMETIETQHKIYMIQCNPDE